MATKKAPADLGSAGRQYWKVVQKGWTLDEHQHMLLHRACRCLDVIGDAEAELATSGLTIEDRFGQAKPAPGVAIVRDMTNLFAKLLGALNLAPEADAEGAKADRRGHP